MNTWKNPNLAFEEAISAGRLSRVRGTPNYAGDYMYMGPTCDGTGNAFKNIITRQYLPPLSPLAALEKLAAGTPAILAATTQPQEPAHSEEAEEALLDALYTDDQHFPAW